jgi:hypothetical protein
MVSRTPPTDVLTALREEVGFHCPAADADGDICGNPYLTWHHFDPPWRTETHHRPEGMIALCRTHADKADNGSYTDDQLRRLKAEGRGRGREVSGRFDWMRRDLLAVVGGNAYFRTPVVIQVSNRPVVWFNRNEQHELLLNFDMPAISGASRASIRDNGWTVSPTDVRELICPPSGRKLDIKYKNGDLFGLKFRSIADRDELLQRFPYLPTLQSHVFPYPLTVVELTQVVAGSPLQLTPKGTLIGTNSITGGLISDCGVGVSIDSFTPLPPAHPAPDSAIAAVLRRARGLPGYKG